MAEDPPPESGLFAERAHASARPVLTSRAAFDAWIARLNETPTPLDALSLGGRERFVDSLDFGERGVRGLSTWDLGRELSQPQIESILRWLGLPAAMVQSDAGKATVDGKPVTHRVAPNRSITPTERRVNAFLRQAAQRSDDASPSRRTARIAGLYDASFGASRSAGDLYGLSDADLRLLLRADLEAASSAPSTHAVEAMQALLPSLQARGVATDADLLDIQNALLRVRNFVAARDLASTHPRASLERIPLLRDEITTAASAPTAWALRDAGKLLERVPVDLSSTRIIVTAGCHFSQDAAAAITTDPLLGPVFARHATWLVAPPGGESIEAVQAWNRRFPDARAMMRYDDTEWRLLPSFGMPNFYVVRAGRVIERVTGWPREGNRDALVAALQQSGLLASR